MPPLNASGTLEQALRQSFDEAAAMYNGTKMHQADGNYSKNAARKSFNGWEYIRGKGGLNINQTESGLELFVVKINDRFERVAILETSPSLAGLIREDTMQPTGEVTVPPLRISCSPYSSPISMSRL
ncbi:MAG: hypothetical protein WKF84_23785 [Pyrinomonadaceae bacterium]